METTFGNFLKKFMAESEVSVSELARLVQVSKGYISDIMNDKKPPPSTRIILDIAKALNADKTELLESAGKVDPELSDYMAESPQAADFLRLAREENFDEEDWDRLKQLAKISKLGKGGKNIQ